MDTKRIMKTIGDLINKNTPTILTALGVVGLVSTSIMAAKASPKAHDILEKERAYRKEKAADGTKPDDISAVDAVKLTWKTYAPTVAMGTITAGCIIGANTVSLRRLAAISSAYELGERVIKEYQAKVVEEIGEKKEQSIRDDISKKHLSKADPANSCNVVITGKGDVLCYDAYSGRYFFSDMESLKKACNDLNKELLDTMFVSLNDLYFAIGLPPINMGDDLGWDANGSGLIELKFSTILVEDGEYAGKPCLYLDYLVGPRFDYRKSM